MESKSKIKEIQDEVKKSEENIANAKQGLERLKSEIPACIVASILTLIFAFYLFPVLYLISAIAAGNAAGKFFFLRNIFKKIIIVESKVVIRGNSVLKLNSMILQSDTEGNYEKENK